MGGKYEQMLLPDCALLPYLASALPEEWVFEGFISGQEVLFFSE